jgi:two-component system phosphate regulon sensor histidine kinase PhoR
MLRLILVLIAMASAFALGHWIADESGALVLGASVVAAFLLWDHWRSARVTDWLKSDAITAPRQFGFWGELQYRIYQRLRGAQRLIDTERSKLDHFLSAIQASPNGVALLDGEDKIEWCNAQLAGHLGIDQERDRAQRIIFVVRHPEFVSYLAEGNFSQPITITVAGMRRLEVQCFAFGERRAEGRVSDGKLLLTRDVTEQERTDTMRRDFVANVSHELKTPLTVLKGFLETMQSLDLSPAERERYLAVMLTQSDRMHHLVSDLLTLAKLEGDTRPPESSVLPMTVIMESLKSQAQALSLGRHRIHVQCDECNLSGNQMELMSAFSNLVSNAVRYTPVDGTINLIWKKLPDGAIFSVTDTGIGIASEHISRLTERFYRVDKGRAKLDTDGRELQGGTGLGLAIVKHALQRHGAELQIDSTEGVGSSFSCHFPSSRIVVPQHESAAEATAV